MAKERKTRRQKILADQRRRHEMASTLEVRRTSQKEQPAVSFTQTSSTALDSKILAPAMDTKPLSHTITTNNYQYLSSDLRKTVVLTGSIIIVALLLRFLTKGM